MKIRTEKRMDKMEWIAPCHFGLESVLKREVQDLGYEIAQVEDGRVTFRGGMDAICRANIFLRTAERILLKVGSFRAVTFDELFERTREIPWKSRTGICPIPIFRAASPAARCIPILPSQPARNGSFITISA